MATRLKGTAELNNMHFCVYDGVGGKSILIRRVRFPQRKDCDPRWEILKKWKYFSLGFINNNYSTGKFLQVLVSIRVEIIILIKTVNGLQHLS